MSPVPMARVSVARADRRTRKAERRASEMTMHPTAEVNWRTPLREGWIRIAVAARDHDRHGCYLAAAMSQTSLVDARPE